MFTLTCFQSPIAMRQGDGALMLPRMQDESWSKTIRPPSSTICLTHFNRNTCETKSGSRLPTPRERRISPQRCKSIRPGCLWAAARLWSCQGMRWSLADEGLPGCVTRVSRERADGTLLGAERVNMTGHDSATGAGMLHTNRRLLHNTVFAA